jgi:hypothetical protein
VKATLLTVGTAAALGTAFVLGTVVSGPSGSSGAPPAHPGPDPDVRSQVAFHAGPAPAGSCDALLASYVDRALGRVTAYGWWVPPYPLYAPGPITHGVVDGAAGPVGQAASAGRPLSGDEPRTTRVTASATGTNVQEQQVDEPDTVKTDGRLLVRVREDELLVYDVSGPRVRRLSTLPLRGLEDAEVLLSGDIVVAVGADSEAPHSARTGEREGTRVQTISLSDPAAPAVTDEVTYGAPATSVRQQRGTVRMVLSAGLPDLRFVHPRPGLPARAALMENRRVVRRSTLRDWLPSYDAGHGRTPLLDCADVAVPSAQVGLGTAAVVTFRADSPGTPTASGLAGATTIAYESPDHLYLASTPTPESGCWECRLPATTGGIGGSEGGGGTSYLFELDLSGDRAVEVASGEVEGVIRDRWSLDEAGGELRVLVGPSTETGDFSSIVTLRRRGDRLVETGRLDGLGRGEDVTSVRWQDDLALVVTYRRVDPLDVVDLRGRPRLLSELRLPGFSSYLHPLGPRRLVGVGSGPQAGGWGAQLGLFRTRDLARMSRLDVWRYGRGTSAVAGEDPRAFTWLPDRRVVLTVVQRGGTGWLSIQHLADERLHNRMVRVEYGTDIAGVRSLELPDGRVVLVTGEQVRFLRV